ncbi:T9SS type A sorting domain-containing protein [bacterium]|nr:T9SS type A sorting domain-containing protein [bacterium]
MKLNRLLTILLMMILVTAAHGGIHRGSSASMRLDAEPPQIGIVTAPEGETFIAGDTLHFAWWASDSYPALHDSNRVAAVLVREALQDSTTYTVTLDHTWDWIAPEVSSANCVFEVTVRDEFGNTATTRSDVFRLLRSDTAAPDTPATIRLAAPAPNPFNPQTTITFALPESGPVDLSVYDLHGRLVRRLHQGALPAGSHTRTWNGRGDDGRRVAGGPYMVRLLAGGGFNEARKVVLLP